MKIRVNDLDINHGQFKCCSNTDKAVGVESAMV